jgi:hypothetical protein
MAREASQRGRGDPIGLAAAGDYPDDAKLR